MSRGILQLAATGKLPLLLEYRTLAMPLQDLRANTEMAEPDDSSDRFFLAGSFELSFGEY